MNLGDLAMLTPYGIGVIAAVVVLLAGVGSTLVETVMTAGFIALLTTYVAAQGITTLAIRLDRRRRENA